jgi:ferredoxin
MYEDYGDIHPWTGPCGLCGKTINERDYHARLSLEEFKKETERTLLFTILCSEKCLETLISFGGKFEKELRHYYSEEPRPRRKPPSSEKEHHLSTCSYCGTQFNSYTQDYLYLNIDEDPYGHPILIVLDDFCKKECYEQALNLKDYLSLSAGAWGPEECIINQLKRRMKRG